MTFQPPYPDRTGEKIVPKGGLVDVEIVALEINTGVYLIQDVLKADPTMKAAPYFISTEGLEELITFIETGVWVGGL